MAKSHRKNRKLSTNEALEQLLGKKAAKRIRKIARQLTGDEKKPQKGKKKPVKAKRREKESTGPAAVDKKSA